MDFTPSGPQANPGQGSSPDVKAPMDPTPSRPQVNTDQGRTDVKALEEALSKLVGEGTASAFERRAQMAGSDAVWADEPSLRATPRIADLKDHPFLGDTPSPRSRFSRALTRFLVVAFIGVGCTLAWQSYGETAKQKLATSAPQLGWVLSLAGLKPWPAELIAERSSGPAVQESPDLPQAVSAAQVTPDVGTPPTSAARAPEVQQQLEAMARDLATLRQSVGQLRQSVDQVVVGQERMARDLASLQAAEKDLRRRISAPKPAAAPPRNPAPKPPPQATPQTLVAPPPQALPPVQLAPDVAAAPPAPPALPPPVQPAPEISGSPRDSPPSRPPMSVLN